MAIISLGSVTIVAMILWLLASVIELFRPLKHGKIGILGMYVTAVLWTFGVTV